MTVLSVIVDWLTMDLDRFCESSHDSSCGDADSLCGPFFWLCYGNTVGNVISLAGEMKTLGLPNDFCLCPSPLLAHSTRMNELNEY